MKTLCFEGASDDTFGWFEKDKPGSGDDYDNSASGEPIQYAILSPATDECMLVFGQYCPELATGWMIGIARFDENDDEHLPNWPASFTRGRSSYSPRLVVEVPHDATVTHVVDAENR